MPLRDHPRWRRRRATGCRRLRSRRPALPTHHLPTTTSRRTAGGAPGGPTAGVAPARRRVAACVGRGRRARIATGTGAALDVRGARAVVRRRHVARHGRAFGGENALAGAEAGHGAGSISAVRRRYSAVHFVVAVEAQDILGVRDARGLVTGAAPLEVVLERDRRVGDVRALLQLREAVAGEGRQLVPDEIELQLQGVDVLALLARVPRRVVVRVRVHRPPTDHCAIPRPGPPLCTAVGSTPDS